MGGEMSRESQQLQVNEEILGLQSKLREHQKATDEMEARRRELEKDVKKLQDGLSQVQNQKQKTIVETESEFEGLRTRHKELQVLHDSCKKEIIDLQSTKAELQNDIEVSKLDLQGRRTSPQPQQGQPQMFVSTSMPNLFSDEGPKKSPKNRDLRVTPGGVMASPPGERSDLQSKNASLRSEAASALESLQR